MGGFTLYPNPATGVFNIEVHGMESGTVHLKVLNILGEVVFSTNVEHAGGTLNRQVDLTALPNGAYYLEVESSTEQAVKMLLKQ